MSARVLYGDCLDVMATLDAESIDAVVTDPPYGLAFMGKAWDHGVPGAAFWTAALRVAKPGAHLVAFGGTRTFHRLTCAIEDAGWEIRDCLSWLYGSGFPKSHNGPWGGTALKPAWEPCILARKPLRGTVAGNTGEYGTGALNIDGCRIAPRAVDDYGRSAADAAGRRVASDGVCYGAFRAAASTYASEAGRWPANVVLDDEAAAQLDDQTGDLQSGVPMGVKGGGQGKAFGTFAGGIPVTGYGDTGGASRFFYTAKASRSEREAGLDHITLPQRDVTRDPDAPGGNNPRNRGAKAVANHHPTVKPLALMQWLVRLVAPRGGLVLDPFCGSGSTGVAALREGMRFVGIEREADYVEIARARLAGEAPLFAQDGAA